jgi:hypothetical protein
MAGISQQSPPEDVLPLVARNTDLLGYNESTQTEFLRLVNRYLHQARELQILAGATGTIHVGGCKDTGTLLKVLGYRMRGECGQPGSALETANGTRAFLTVDSGFPLIELEEALQKDAPFDYAYPTSWVPVLFRESDWLALGTSQKVGFGSVVDVLANDHAIARLYWAMAKADQQTARELQRTVGLRQLLPMGPTLDFYGSQISVRSGRVVVPGGAAAEAGWKELVGANPDAPKEFVTQLLENDNGWLAAYFDALSRTSPEQQKRLTEPRRLKAMYEAYRSVDAETPAARGVFQQGAGLVVLFNRLQWGPGDEIAVPGGVAVWQQILDQDGDSAVRILGKRLLAKDRPEEMLNTLVALSRMPTDSGPLQVYLTLSELERSRPADRRLPSDMVRLLAGQYSKLSSWYLIFNEFPNLSDRAIEKFVTVAQAINKISDLNLRGNAMGIFQANVGLWQILARQGEIAGPEQDASWLGMIEPFAKVGSPVQLLDDARKSLAVVMTAATGKAGDSQEAVIDVLAGPQQQSAEGQQVHTALAERIRSVLNDQRLVSLDTLFALSDGLGEMARGKAANRELLGLAEELRDFELPRQIFSKSEKVEWAPHSSESRHAELQLKTDLTKVIREHGSRAQLEAARGQLAPLLRDALVGLNYAYYEPPSAQILHINPMFVRSHDFVGTTVGGAQHLWQAPMLIGAGQSAGGGAYLVGSLADLPYSLATAEQDMIAPEHVQALIWNELVPEILADAVLERWWNVTANELHAVALYQQLGEELLRGAVGNQQLRSEVVGILTDRMDPQNLERLEQALENAHDLTAFLPRVMPANTFYLGTEFLKRFPDEAAAVGQTGGRLRELATRYPEEVNGERLSRDFGIPHPTLARTYGRELLNMKPIPFYGEYSSRLFGERWESGNLYWARLADEMGYSPVMLNRMVPDLSRRMIAKIFASDLEDWPAVLRAMEETGDEFRQGKNGLQAAANGPGVIAPAAIGGKAQ